MQDKALYLIAIFDNKTQNKLAEYYDVLCQNGFVGSQTKNIPYHLTLGSRSIDSENQTINDLEEVCSNIHSFEINLAHIGLFGLKVLFISPNMNFELLKLQQSFFPDCGNGHHPWSAHVTLLIDESETILKALPIVAENFQPFKARVEGIELYEFFPRRFVKAFDLAL
ncbi:MAG: 2'-5' RNA ligase family protein [Defluviitaleaceae bacterium]|nr:2'-5' RNA ligase family protein [Defluviitaleaceae bacterium]